MAYVAPDSNIELCRGFPLDRGHEYAIYFADAASQYSAIHAYASKIYEKNSYQRVNKKTLRIGEIADNLQGVNYMIFQNAAFGTKHFYAFVDEVNYINNSVSEIVYTIDPLQTYLFDFNWNACPVLREHTVSDNLGEHTESEEIGEPTRNYSLVASQYYNDWVYFIMSTKNLDTNDIDPSDFTKASDWPNARGGVYSGVYQGASFYRFNNLDTLKNIIKYLDNFGLSGAIVGIFAIPEAFVASTDIPLSPVFTFSKTLTGLSFGGYTPKNKKLYMSPFCKLILSGNGTQSKEFDIQGFGLTGSAVSGAIECTSAVSPNAQIIAYPTRYRGIGGQDTTGETPAFYGAKEWSIQIGSVIQGSWSSNAYANWQAQSQIDRTMTNVMGVVAAAVAIGSAVVTEGATAGVAAGAIGSLIGRHVSQAAEDQKMKNLPNTVSGGSSGDLNLSQNDFGVRVYFAFPVPAQAEKIDNYFTRYGYACNKIKVPSINNRPYWTYVKTNGCAFTPKIGTGIPAPDMEAINSYFDNGITWFKTAADVGRFDRDNSPA